MDGKQLRAFRLELGLNQAEFGEIFGYEQSAIARMESGQRLIPASISRGRATALRWLRQRAERQSAVVIKYMTGACL